MQDPPPPGSDGALGSWGGKGKGKGGKGKGKSKEEEGTAPVPPPKSKSEQARELVERQHTTYA